MVIEYAELCTGLAAGFVLGALSIIMAWPDRPKRR
jgi:hypothetical protein